MIKIFFFLSFSLSFALFIIFIALFILISQDGKQRFFYTKCERLQQNDTTNNNLTPRLLDETKARKM
jgi:hypothetical protein